MVTVKLISYLLRMSRHLRLSRLAVAVALVTGLASGLGLTGLLVIVSNVMAGRSGHGHTLLYGFIALCVIVPTSRLVSQSIFNRLATQAVFETRLQSCRQILAAPLRGVEELGSHRLLATLTDDITTLTTALMQVPLLCLHLAVFAACLGYMGWLSWRMLLIVLGIMALGAVTYGLSMARARSYFVLLREQTDRMFAHFRSLIHGAKELKLHERRQATFISAALIPTGEAIRGFTARGNIIYIAAAVWGNLLFWIAIGLLVFGFRGAWFVDARVMSGFTLSLLYVLSPLEVIFQILPNFGRAAAAVRKLDKLGIDLTAEAAGGTGPPPAGWRRLELKDVEYSYGAASGESFSIGPLSLALHAGELIFLTGGNGSGKSTVAKILTGLYLPDAGEILLDGRPIASENRHGYRQLFSTVFSDFYLFENLIGLEQAQLDDAASTYLVRLQLDKKVSVEGGRLSTLDLSQGQRKRLALLSAYMEQRPIYVFDEWAADQDPRFKSIFYFELLPELKAMGKTVFVISHDDQYYSLADRLVKMTDGRIEWDRVQSSTAAELAGSGR